MATDLLLLLLPVKPLMKLQIRKAQKIALAAIFSGGFITLIITAIRLYLIYNIDFTDLSFSVASSNYLTVIQPGIAIVVACSPLLKPVMDRILGSSSDTKQRVSGGGSGQEGRARTHPTIRNLKFGRGPARAFSSLSPSGFDRISDSEEHLPVELGFTGRNEAYVAAQGDDTWGGNSEPGVGTHGGIILTHQTVVAGGL
ncbi:hypothetical protein DL771_001619 [Monosporascus sp. 5C6A]|nr:hypothetical protein DL771_001619 [Monosporascus sp. 5C6A]